jgi:outer membrane protein assembly factor BamB
MPRAARVARRAVLALALSLAAATSSWPQHAAGPTRASTSPLRGPNASSALVTLFRSGGALVSPPITVDAPGAPIVTFVGQGNDINSIFLSNSSVAWSVRSEGVRASSTTPAGAAILASTAIAFVSSARESLPPLGFIFALSAADGSVLWADASPDYDDIGSAAPPLALPDDTLVVVTLSGLVRRYAAATGALLWKVSVADASPRANFLAAHALVPGARELVAVPAGCGVVALAVADGASVWNFSLPQCVAPALPFAGAVAVSPSGALLFGTAPDGVDTPPLLLALDGATGRELWRVPTARPHAANRAAAFSPDGARAYLAEAAGANFSTYALDTATGARVWTVNFTIERGANSVDLTPAVGADDVLYVAIYAPDLSIVALRGIDGSIAWQLPISDGSESVLIDLTRPLLVLLGDGLLAVPVRIGIRSEIRALLSSAPPSATSSPSPSASPTLSATHSPSPTITASRTGTKTSSRSGTRTPGTLTPGASLSATRTPTPSGSRAAAAAAAAPIAAGPAVAVSLAAGFGALVIAVGVVRSWRVRVLNKLCGIGTGARGKWDAAGGVTLNPTAHVRNVFAAQWAAIDADGATQEPTLAPGSAAAAAAAAQPPSLMARARALDVDTAEDPGVEPGAARFAVSAVGDDADEPTKITVPLPPPADGGEPSKLVLDDAVFVGAVALGGAALGGGPRGFAGGAGGADSADAAGAAADGDATDDGDTPAAAGARGAGAGDGR